MYEQGCCLSGPLVCYKSTCRDNFIILLSCFRSSLQTQYTQLVHYFTHKGATDLKAREEELHSHYMEELSRFVHFLFTFLFLSFYSMKGGVVTMGSKPKLFL